MTASLAGLRIILPLHALGVLAQAALAGQFLSGLEDPVVFHAWTAWAILVLSLAQVALAVAASLKGGALWFMLTSVFVLLAEALQTGTGYGRFLGVHIPLGVVLFGVVLWQTIWVFRKPALTPGIPR
jgi:cytochrome b561